MASLHMPKDDYAKIKGIVKETVATSLNSSICLKNQSTNNPDPKHCSVLLWKSSKSQRSNK